MTVENWPGRGYYRGNKKKMLHDAHHIMGIVDEPLPSPPPIEVRASAAAPADLNPGPSQIDRNQALGMGYTGDQCDNCNSMKMKISGHCKVCEDCGTTTGCS
jgi:hypothetical protein